MSRIGKKPVQVPAGVTASVNGQTVSAKGPKGELNFVVNDEDLVKMDNGGTARAAIATTAADMGLRVRLGVRPEDFLETTGDAIFTGEVEITEALGEVTLLYFKRQGEGAQVVAKLPGIHSDLRRKVVKLGADPKKIHLFSKGKSLLYR